MEWPIIIGITLVLNCSFVGLAKGSLEEQGTNDTCLKVAVETHEPFILVEETDLVLRVSGIMTDVLNIVGGKLGRCIEFTTSPIRGMGYPLGNGSWVGVLGLIHEKEADFSGVIMAINDLRSRNFDYSTPLLIDDKILCHKWPGIQSDMNGVFKPFTPGVWLFFGIMLVVAGCVTVALQRGRTELDYERRLKEVGLQVKEAKETQVIRKESFRRSLWNSCYWTLGSILAQPCSWYPTGNSIRVMTGLWLLLSLVVNTVYRSNLKAMLILPRVQLPFDSMEELVQSGIKTFVPAGSMMYYAMAQAPEDALLNRLQKQALIHYDIAKATRNTLNGKHASFTGRASFKFVLHKILKRTGKCPLLYMASETFFGATPCSLAFAKGSSLLPQIDPILWRLKESGIISFMFNTATAKSTYCSKLRVTNTSRSLELADFYGVFLIYIGGMVLSLVEFAMEKFAENSKRKKLKLENLIPFRCEFVCI